MATAAQVRKVLVQGRAVQMRLTSAGAQRIAKAWTAALEAVQSLVREATAFSGAALVGLLTAIDRVLKALRADFYDILQVGLLALAQAAAHREALMAALVGAEEDTRLAPDRTLTATLSDDSIVEVTYSAVAALAVAGLAARHGPDGKSLKDRLERLDQLTSETIDAALSEGIAEGLAGDALADHVAEALSAAGVGKAGYQADRLARTEMTAAHRAAHIEAVTEPETRELKPYVQAIGWRLSLSHSRHDMCDLYAAHDASGLGPGNYLPGSVPGSHPYCMCSQVSILVDVPDERGPGKTPEPEKVPETLVRYHAGRGDAAAVARLAVIEERAAA